MTITFGFQGDEQQANMSRRMRVHRGLTAVMAYHSGFLEDYGISAASVDHRSNDVSGDYINIDLIPENRVVSTYSFATQFEHFQDEVVLLDRHTLRRAIHLPPVNSEPVAAFPNNLVIDVSAPGGNVEPVSFANYEAFHTAYRDLAFSIVHMPSIVLDVMKEDMWRTFGPSISHDMRIRLEGEAFIPPEVRISGAEDELTVSELLSSNRFDGRLVTVLGQVTEIGDTKKRPVRIAWKCMHPGCGLLTYRMCDPFEDSLEVPNSCHYCGAGQSSEAPKSNFVMDDPPNTTMVQYQRMLVKQIDTFHTTPPQILMEMRGTKVNSVNQGEDVAVSGIYRSLKVEGRGSKMERIPLLFITNLSTTSSESTVEVTETERIALTEWANSLTWEQLCLSVLQEVAPLVIGHDIVKMALVLQQIGAYPDLRESAKRQFIHILLMGDPGTAKSQLIKWALSMHPGSKEATGARTTIPGLLGGKSDNQRLLGASSSTIAPGMLALIPPGGIAAIDELHALNRDKQSILQMLNDAMESGKVHLTMQMKGTVRTPTPILSGANPMAGDNGRFDRSDTAQPLLEQTALPNSFASRKDGIYAFFDEVNEERDREIISGIIRASDQNNALFVSQFPVEDGLKKYLQLCREVMVDSDTPMYAEGVEDEISEISIKARQNSVGGATVTYRWVDALIRFSQAAARMQLSPTVEKHHVKYAFEILQESLTTKEPNMVNEGGTGLSSRQIQVHEEILARLEDFYHSLPDDQEWGQADDAKKFIQENWSLPRADFEVPDSGDLARVMHQLASQGKIRVQADMVRFIA